MIAVFDICYFPELESDRYTQVVWLELLEVTEAIFDAAIMIIDNDMLVIKNACGHKPPAKLSTVDQFFISQNLRPITVADLEARIEAHNPAEFYLDPQLYASKLHRLSDHNLTIKRISNL